MSDEHTMPEVIYASDSSCDMMYGKWWRSKELDHYTPYLRCPDNVDPSTIAKGLADMATTIATLTAERDALVEASQDMLSGWRYIRQMHGDLYGVGWDRAQSKVESALAQLKEQPDG